MWFKLTLFEFSEVKLNSKKKLQQVPTAVVLFLLSVFKTILFLQNGSTATRYMTAIDMNITGKKN